MFKHIYEHLKTKKKYNTLQLKYEVKCEELEQKIFELDTQKKINRVEKEQFEQKLKEYVDEIKQNSEEIQKLKSEIKSKKKIRKIKRKQI